MVVDKEVGSQALGIPGVSEEFVIILAFLKREQRGKSFSTGDPGTGQEEIWLRGGE